MIKVQAIKIIEEPFPGDIEKTGDFEEIINSWIDNEEQRDCDFRILSLTPQLDENNRTKLFILYEFDLDKI